MPDITIPDAAVEAAARAQFEWSGDESWDDYTDHDHDVRNRWRHETRAGLRVAAPYIAAQALRDLLADAPESGRPPTPFTSWREWITARADRIEATNG